MGKVEKTQAPHFYLIREIAEACQLSHHTIADYVRTGRIPAVRHGRRWVVLAEDLPEVRKYFLMSRLPGEPQEEKGSQ